MPIDYVTAYEISKRLPDWPFACAGLLPMAAGALIIWAKRRFTWTQPHWLLAIFFLLFGTLWVTVFGFGILLADSDAYKAYMNGDYQVVEGTVTAFRPMPYEGHQDECFSVEDQRFCYSDYMVAPGFHNATSHGGPIRAGLPVRIAYKNGRILKLEVPRGDMPKPAQSASITSQGERQWQQRAENDPLEQELTIAAFFTAMCWTLWWNLQWKRVMRFWLRPPYRRWAEIGFRVFFAMNFFGAVLALARQIHAHPLSRDRMITTIQIASAMCVLFALMSAFALWMIQRRDAKAQL